MKCRFLVMLVLSVGAIGCGSEVDRWAEMRTNSVLASAKVTGKNCSNHGAVRYLFWVADKSYSGTSYWVPCDKIKVGDQLNVRYHPDAPMFNTTMTPERAYSHYRTQSAIPYVVGLFLVLALAIPIFRSAR